MALPGNDTKRVTPSEPPGRGWGRAQLRRRLHKVEQDNERLRQQNEHLQRQVEEFQEELGDKDKAIADRDKRIADLERQLAKTQTEFDQLLQAPLLRWPGRRTATPWLAAQEERTQTGWPARSHGT